MPGSHWGNCTRVRGFFVCAFAQPGRTTRHSLTSHTLAAKERAHDSSLLVWSCDSASITSCRDVVVLLLCEHQLLDQHSGCLTSGLHPVFGEVISKIPCVASSLGLIKLTALPPLTSYVTFYGVLVLSFVLYPLKFPWIMSYLCVGKMFVRVAPAFSV